MLDLILTIEKILRENVNLTDEEYRSLSDKIAREVYGQRESS